MKFFAVYLKQRRIGICVLFIFCLIFLCTFLLYHLPVGAVLYPALICTLLGIVILALDFYRAYKKHQQLKALMKLSSSLMESFPAINSQDDEDYQQIINLLKQEQMQLENNMNLRYMDMVDYYTIWAHQIKTPIASMRLTLQNEDTAFSRKISEDLFRIEQYVQMVLMFLRLDSDSTDYVIKEYNLD